MYTPTSLLDAAVRTLIEQKGETVVSLWFSEAKAVALKDGLLVISAPNALFRDTLEQQFTDNVTQIITHITGGSLRPLYILEDEASDWCNNQNESIYARYTFDHFIVGNSNKFAHAAANAVAQSPGTAYNPLFIYGPSGLGKTHLIYAIAGEVRKQTPSAQIVYKKGDDFANEMIESIQAKTMPEFRERYRKANLLLVDDVQFIAGMERVQEEFFHTFNAVHESGGQIVLTSDRPPKEIRSLAERLRTRFESGLLADVQPPDLETRMALVAEKSELIGIKMPQSVVLFIAESIVQNVRELEGAVKKIAAIHKLMLRDIDLPMAQEAIKDLLKSRPGLKPTPQLILNEVCTFYSVAPEKIMSNNKAKDILLPRQVATYLIRELTDLSLPDIAKIFDQHHTTVMHAINRLNEQMNEQDELRAKVDDLKKNIQSR